MGNLCAKPKMDPSAMVPPALQEIDKELEKISEQIRTQIFADHDSEIIFLKVKKQSLRALLESQSINSGPTKQKIQKQPLLSEALLLLKQLTGKSFVPINFTNDPESENVYFKIILANFDRILRFDTEERSKDVLLSIMETTKIETQTVSLDNNNILHEQIQSIIRGFYDDSSQIILGCLQDMKTPSQLIFILANPHKYNKGYQHIDSEFFINVEPLDSMDTVMKPIVEYDQFLQGIITIKNSKLEEKNFIIFKDYEYRQQEYDIEKMQAIFSPNSELPDITKDQHISFVHQSSSQQCTLVFGKEKRQERKPTIKKKINVEALVHINYEALHSPLLAPNNTQHVKMDSEPGDQPLQIPNVQAVSDLVKRGTINLEEIEYKVPVGIPNVQPISDQVKRGTIVEDDQQEHKVPVDLPNIQPFSSLVRQGTIQQEDEYKEEDLGASAFSIVSQSDLVEDQNRQFEQILQEREVDLRTYSIAVESEMLDKGRKRSSIVDLNYMNEEIAMDNYVFEFWDQGKEFIVNSNKAIKGEPILSRIDSIDMIINSSITNAYTHGEVNYDSENDQSKFFVDEEPTNSYQISSELKFNLQFLGVEGLWKIYKIQDGPYLYKSLNQRVLANCIYEVHFYKKFIQPQSLYQNEFVFINKKTNQINSFAVIVNRPPMDLVALSNVWSNTDLTEQKKEQASDPKRNYLLLQVLLLLQQIKEKKIVHNMLSPTSFLFDLNSYTLQIYNLAFAQHENQSEKQKIGYIQGVEDQYINLISALSSTLNLNMDIEEIAAQEELEPAINQIRKKCQSDVGQLFYLFKKEEKHDLAFKNAIQLIQLQKEVYKNFYFEIGQEDDLSMSDINSSFAYNQQLTISELLIKKYPMPSVVRSLQQSFNPPLFFALLQDLYCNGDYEVLLDVYEQFKVQMQVSSSIFCEFSSLIVNDLTGQPENIPQSLNLSDTPLRERAIVSILFSQLSSDRIEECQNIFKQLDNEQNPLYVILLLLQNKKGLNLEIIKQTNSTAPNTIPKYFEQRLLFQSMSNLSNQGDQKEIAQVALLKFKIVKNFISLMLFHQYLVQFDMYQHEAPQALNVFCRFGLDLFTRHSSLKKDFKSFCASLTFLVGSAELVKEILSCFGSEQSSTKYEAQQSSFRSPAHIISFILHEIKEFCISQGIDNVTASFQHQFEKQTYTSFINQQCKDEKQFSEYLALILGLKEDLDRSLIDLQTKFMC